MRAAVVNSWGASKVSLCSNLTKIIVGINVISKQSSKIRDEQYLTEPGIGTSDARLKKAEFDIKTDITLNFSPISDVESSKKYA